MVTSKWSYQTRTVIIERKTPSDFINSSHATIKDPSSKLARQLNGCLAVADTTILLIDGLYYGQRDGKMKAGKISTYHDLNAFAGKLRTIMAHGIRVEHNPSDWFLPQFLVALYRYELKNEHSTLALAPKAFSVDSKENAKWTVLMGIRGVGPSLARLLLAEFGSVRDVSAASTSQLMKVKGVGEKTAEKILWYLT